MGNKKKMVFNVLFLVLIFAGTIYGVFHGEDIGQISDILQTVNPWWLIPGVVCVVVFIWGESIIIHYMMRNLGVNVGRGTCSRRLDSFSAVSRHLHQVDSRLRYII